MKYFRFAFALLIITSIFSSCKKEEISKLQLQNDIFISRFSDSLPPEQLDFSRLDVNEPDNISHRYGTKGQFFWLKIDFEIPQDLKNKDLGLVISYLTFADEVYINGAFAGSYGSFPPYERSALFSGHFYPFPKNVLNQEGNNTILVKLWSHGYSAISRKVYVTDLLQARSDAATISFFNSSSYFVFEGGMFCAVILFFIIYVYRRKNKNFKAFALLNISTMFLLTPFFGADVPWYSNRFMPYIWFVKILLWCSLYLVVYFTSLFILRHMNITPDKKVSTVRVGLLVFQIIVTLCIPDIDTLLKITPWMVFISFVIMGSALFYHFKGFFDEKRRHLSIELVKGFTPLLLGLAGDFVNRVILDLNDVPFMTLYGWQGTIITFVFFLARSYSRVSSENEVMNEKLLGFNRELEKEVLLKTRNLSDLNERLAMEIQRSNADLEMASIIQQKFLQMPESKYNGWDVAICYKPAAKVSGDLFDFYTSKGNLNGCSLFDVSGHGIGASLVTMLAKNIVFRNFTDSVKKGKKVSSALMKINAQIVAEKGDIENYLTGLLFKFDDFNNESCTVHLSNAGHPHPLLFKNRTKECIEIIHDASQKQFGAIGIKGIEVSFPEIQFDMEENDVLMFFTDGILETASENRELFGKERVMKILSETASLPSDQIILKTQLALKEFAGTVPADDDLTIVVLKRESLNVYAQKSNEETEELETLEEAE